MSKEPIYRWSGEYFGFIRNSKFFDSNSEYLGWIEEDGRVWNKNGEYIGEIVENNYILVKTNKMKPMNKIPKIPPIPPIPPIPKINKMGKMPKMGWEDALDSYK